MLTRKGWRIASHTSIVLTISTAMAAASTNLAGSTTTVQMPFDQPLENGIANGLLVPPATGKGVPKGQFELILWQVDHYTSNGLPVPTAWDAGSQTGFTPLSPSTAQLGFQNKSGTSTAQMEGDAVGAYLNSRDMPTSTTSQKMMITPEYRFAAGSIPVPFASSTSILASSMELQIPVALGKQTYVNADLLFIGPNGEHVSYGIKLFHNGVNKPTTSTGYDVPTNGYILDTPLGSDPQYVTKASTSASSTGTPWLGWQHFEWSISQSQFVAALLQLAATFPGKIQSTDPTQYILTEVHLNAEMHFLSSPAELGWSMRDWKVWISG